MRQVVDGDCIQEPGSFGVGVVVVGFHGGQIEHLGESVVQEGHVGKFIFGMVAIEVCQGLFVVFLMVHQNAEDQVRILCFNFLKGFDGDVGFGRHALCLSHFQKKLPEWLCVCTCYMGQLVCREGDIMV